MRTTIKATLVALVLLGGATPAHAEPLTGVASVAAGGPHSCALMQNRQVRCWGDNSYGGLGDGSIQPHNRAVVVKNRTGTGPLSGVRAVTTGSYHTCALLADARVACWGDNFSGQLGTGGTDLQSTLPVVVANAAGTGPLTDVAQVSAGGNSTCARLTSGQVVCWGSNMFRQLGDGTTDPSSLPVTVLAPFGTGPLVDVSQIDVGDGHACARLRSTEAVCWGSNAYGQLGANLEDEQAFAVAVAAVRGPGHLTGIRRIDAGHATTCAVRNDRTARCWGSNEAHQLGTPDDEARFRPIVIRRRDGGPALTGIGTIQVGYAFICTRMTDGTVRCWGTDDSGQLGNGPGDTPTRFPTAVAGLTGVTQVQTGDSHVCVRVTSGQARCWGLNIDGQLGDGRSPNRHRPVAVSYSTGGG